MAKWLGYFTLALIFGSGFLFINIASKEVTAFELTAARMVISASVLFTLLKLTGQHLPRHWPQLRGLILLGFINYTIPFTLLTLGQQRGVNSGLSGVLAATNPLFTVVIAHFAFDDERLSPLRIAGVLGGLVGTGILASRDISSGSVLTDALLGQFMIIMAAFSFAASNVYSRVVMRETLSPLVVGTGATLGGMIGILPIMALDVLSGTPITNPMDMSMKAIIAVLTLALAHSVLPAVLTKFVIRELGASVMSTTTYLVPIIALILGAVFLNETINARVMMGTAVILSSVALANFGKRLWNLRRRKQPPQTEDEDAPESVSVV